MSLFRRPSKTLRGGLDPVALQERSVTARRENRRRREEAERARLEVERCAVAGPSPEVAHPSPTPAVEPDPEGVEAGVGMRELLLRFAPRSRSPVAARVLLEPPPRTRDIRREGEQYFAEIAARARRRDAALTRPVRHVRRWYDDSGALNSLSQLRDYEF